MTRSARAPAPRPHLQIKLTCSFPTTTARSSHGTKLCTTNSRRNNLAALRSSPDSSCPFFGIGAGADTGVAGVGVSTNPPSTPRPIAAGVGGGLDSGLVLFGQSEARSGAGGWGFWACGEAEKRGRIEVWWPYVLRIVSWRSLALRRVSLG